MAAQADSSTRTSRSGAVQTRGAILREPGTNSGWQVEDIEIDPPKEGEVLIKLTASGMCHSDDHVNTGDIPLDWGPIIGGHEGAGVIEAIGPNVRDLQPGDHVLQHGRPRQLPNGRTDGAFDERTIERRLLVFQDSV